MSCTLLWVYGKFCCYNRAVFFLLYAKHQFSLVVFKTLYYVLDSYNVRVKGVFEWKLPVLLYAEAGFLPRPGNHLVLINSAITLVPVLTFPSGTFALTQVLLTLRLFLGISGYFNFPNFFSFVALSIALTYSSPTWWFCFMGTSPLLPSLLGPHSISQVYHCIPSALGPSFEFLSRWCCLLDHWADLQPSFELFPG